MRGNQQIKQDLKITRRYLPHWQAGGSTYFITFRVANGKALLSASERAIIKTAILHWHHRRWLVHMLTVMPDHVHILATPLEESKGSWYSLSNILSGAKYWSAREINRLRQHKGQLWQHESYDRLIRNEWEFDQKSDYIINNALLREVATDAMKYDGFWCESFEAMEELEQRRASRRNQQ